MKSRRFRIRTWREWSRASSSLRVRYARDRAARGVARYRLVEGIANIRALTLVTPRDASRRAGIVSLRAADAERISTRLTAAGIVHSIRGHGVLRFAPHFYNTIDEIDRVLEQLDG